MEERYEIRGKIGQGGLGAVYRGYDTRMSREVAIKRISTGGGDDADEEESTRQLIKEAGALASLQHPHIVTVYDVGTDEDGPYVVMELISGKTLDELIENAPLTWTDFRELAMQTQEALIAAHELDLIHSDLKPSNLMLSWLPSGKFQVKIVDFGLATLTKSQSKEDLEAMEAVFGSIFFMPPEQFERKPLDMRSDLYSMGCVYYQTLAGRYPFDGKTGTEVMTAHLNHTVTPLQEIRSDIPLWVCDWIMWQLNREPEHRPESARDSLTVFLQNDKNPNPTMSLGIAEDPNAPKRPRLIIPGSEPQPPAETPAAIAIPVAPLPVQEPIPEAAPASTEDTPPAAIASLPVDPVDTPNTVSTKSAPQPLTPPEGSMPSVHTSSHDLPEPEPEPATAPVATAAAVPSQGPLTKPMVKKAAKRKLSNSAKTTIAALLGILTVFMAWFLLNRSAQNRQTELYNAAITEAAKGDAVEVEVNAEILDILLESAANVGANKQRQTIYKALFLAKATDATNVDARIAKFATTRPMLPDVREVLIRDVLRKRKNPEIVPTLMAFARTTDEPRAAVAALQSVRFMAGDDQFDNFLSVVQETNNDEIRKAAEENLAQIIKKSKNREKFINPLATSYKNSLNDDVRFSMLRLLGRCAGPEALELAKESLGSTEDKDKVAAVVALGAWGDDSGFPLLIDTLATASDPKFRIRTFDSAMRYVSDTTVEHDPAAWQEQWTSLNSEARTRAEQEKMIRGLVNFDDEWASKLIEAYTDSEDDRINDIAGNALDHIRERKSAKGE